MFYLMKWLGYPNDGCSREPAENLVNTQELLKEFHLTFPHKPKL